MKKTLSLMLALTLAMALTVPAMAAIPEFTNNDLAAYRREMAEFMDNTVSMERQGAQGQYGKDAWRAEGTVPCRGIDYESITECSYSVVSMDTTWTVTNNSPDGLLLWINLSTWETYSARRGAEDYVEAGYLRWSGGKFANGMIDDIAVGESVTFSVADIAAALDENKPYEDEAYELVDGDLFLIEFALYDPDAGYSITEPKRSDGRFFKLDAAAVETVLAQAPAASEAPATPETPAVPASGTAYASTQTVELDGKKVEFQMYALKEANGGLTNYIKVRDLAFALNGTKAQFSVDWDGQVNLVGGSAYTPNGSENSTPFSGDRAYTVPTSPTNVNGEASDLSAIVLTDDNGGGYNYYKLRDLGSKLGFNVDWTAERGVFIESDKPYGG